MRLALFALMVLTAALPADAQTAPGDVVVTAAPSLPRGSDWVRADTAHAILYSDGSAKELSRVARTIERLHQLLARLYHVPARDETKPLIVTLVGRWDRLAGLDVGMPASDDGAYLATHAGQRISVTRDDGASIVMARSDQLIDLNTRRRLDEDCAGSDVGEGAAVQCLNKDAPFYPPVTRQWEAALYSAYTQHFLRTYIPAGYPRWYLDGVGELFSTVTMRDDGSIDYARPPAGYWDVLSAYGVANIADVLAGQASTGRNAPVWTPHAAWLIAHFLLVSDPGKAWQTPFARYMTAVHQGMPLDAAAKLLGSPTRLQRSLRAYVDRGKRFAHAAPDAGGRPDPLVTPLSADSGALFEARLALDLSLTDTAPAKTERLRDRLAALPAGTDATLLRAEFACRIGDYDACAVAADTVLATTPDSVAALGWKGMALTKRPDTLASGRALLERAMALDDTALQPRLAYFVSYVDARQPASDTAMRAIAKVIQAVPSATAPRLALAGELVRQGNADLARRLLTPVLANAADTAERRAAQALVTPSAPRG